MALQKLSARAARAYVTHIAKKFLHHDPLHVRRRGGGLSNFVYLIQLRDQSLIVRMHPEAQQLQTFQRQRRAMQLAHGAGIPVPHVVHVGADPYPFMVVENVRGVVGTHAHDRIGALRQIGELTARIHGIQMQGFGPSALDPPSTGAPRRHTWGAHLEGDLHASERIATLEKLGMFLPDNAEKMRRTLAHMGGWRRNPVLHHGDMRLKNVIVDEAGKISAVIDWDNCTASVPALFDLAVALHDLNIDEKQVLLQGYGYGPRELTKAIAYMRLLNALNYTPFIVALAERGDKTHLNWLRARMAGDFNLYQ